MKNRKIPAKVFAQIVAGVLVLAMLIGATYAWTDYTQHKVNNTSGKVERFDAGLVDDYKPITEWPINQPTIPKIVAVANTGVTDSAKDVVAGDVYVRVALKEFMSIAPINYVYSDIRYAVAGSNKSTIDTTDPSKYGDGGFICFTDPGTTGYNEAAEWISKQVDNKGNSLAAYYGDPVWLPDGNNPTADTMPFNAPGWYIPTQYGSANGEYGKFILLSADAGVQEPLVSRTIPSLTPGNDENVAYTAGNMPEYNWPLYRWLTGNDLPDKHELASKTLPAAMDSDNVYSSSYDLSGDEITKIRDYVTIGFNTGAIVSLSKWKTLPDKSVGYWVYDDTADTNNPYVYWSLPIPPKDLGNNVTANLVNTLTLKNRPDGDFKYELFVDMQAVSLYQMAGQWGTTDPMLALYQPIGLVVPDFGNFTQSDVDGLFQSYSAGGGNAIATLTDDNVVSLVIVAPGGENTGSKIDLAQIFPVLPATGITVKSTFSFQPANQINGNEYDLVTGFNGDLYGEMIKVILRPDRQWHVIVNNADTGIVIPDPNVATTYSMTIKPDASGNVVVEYTIGSNPTGTASNIVSWPGATPTMKYADLQPDYVWFCSNYANNTITISSVEITPAQ